MKILADILALVLDEQAGVSASALAAVRQRAQAEGVTGGALKDAFLNARSGVRDEAVALATARARIEALQSQVIAAEQMRRQQSALTASLLRRARLLALATGLLAGVSGAVLASIVWG